jgi:hypothetical protein
LLSPYYVSGVSNMALHVEHKQTRLTRHDVVKYLVQIRNGFSVIFRSFSGAHHSFQRIRLRDGGWGGGVMLLARTGSVHTLFKFSNILNNNNNQSVFINVQA